MSKKEEKLLQDKLEQMEEVVEDKAQENLVRNSKMGNMPIGKLLVSTSLPIVFSMIVSALYNVVDSIFVARLSEDALAAVGLVFPVFNLMIAFSVGTAVGINSLLSRRLGEQNVDSANRVTANGLFITLLTWGVFALFGTFGTDIYFRAVTAGAGVGAHIIEMGTTYMRIVTIASFGLFMQITLERLLTATGRSIYTMIGQIAGTVVNIVLDPIMIFGLLGFPAMGVAGAAWATVIGQLCGMFIMLYFNIRKNPEVHIRLRGFRPNWGTIKHIYQVGLPSIIMQSVGSVMTFTLNKILVGFGTTPVSVFNVYFQLQSFVFMPVIGFNNGAIPVIAFNYGAQKRKRIDETIRIALIIGAGIMAVGTAIFQLFPGWLLSLFGAGPEMMAIGTTALRTISLGFLLASVSVIFTGVFQALGQGLYSLIMSVVRQLVFLLPIAWLLARLQGLDAIWWAFPIAEVMCTVCAVLFFRSTKRRVLDTMPAEK